MLQIPGLFITHSEGRGRGVFSAREIGESDLIEVCPIILIPAKQLPLIDQTVLHDYYFLWPKPEGSACIALGYGSIYNHSFQPNAKIVMDLEKQEIEIQCVKTIEAGTEIFIDYTDGEGQGSGRLWFEVVDS